MSFPFTFFWFFAYISPPFCLLDGVEGGKLEAEMLAGWILANGVSYFVGKNWWQNTKSILRIGISDELTITGFKRHLQMV